MAPLNRPIADIDFILTEQDGHLSRDNAILKMGQDLPPGTPLVDDGTGKLIAMTSGLNSAGGALVDTAGILCYATDATDADTAVVILDDLAEVNGRALN